MKDMNIAIIDYGMGNLRSVQKAFERVGALADITSNPQEILKAKKVVLPGVGAMAPAMLKLRELKLIEAIYQTILDQKPFLGICLGLQLLFETSSEGGCVEGLKILEGSVERFDQNQEAVLKVPHMGWNQIKTLSAGATLYKKVDDMANVYFCHSFYVKPKDLSIAASTTSYGHSYVSSIVKDNIWGVQFHPEKSQKVGLQILRNFAEL